MANLSGTWLGPYWQQGNPTRFEVTFVQGGNTLSGSILDDCHLGEAKVSGEVIGRNVRFVKQYLTTSPEPVAYVGTVSEQEDLIQGDWFLTGISGTWEARRGSDDLMISLRSRLTAQIPVALT